MRWDAKGLAVRESAGFCVCATCPYNPTQTESGVLSLAPGEELRVLSWSKRGWWWAQRLRDGQCGWVSSALLRPRAEEPLCENGQEQERAARLWGELAAAASLPPLPPGPPPSNNLDATPSSKVDVDYATELGFLAGRCVGLAEPTDRAQRQMQHYFDVDAWERSQTCTTEESLKRGSGERRTGDGGIKRRRGPNGQTAT